MKPIACILLLLCIGAAQPLAVIDPSHIDRITIAIDVGGLGSATHYHRTFHRREGGTFISNDGKSTISRESVLALAQALQNPPAGHFDFSRTWITPAVLRQYLPLMEQHFLGPGRFQPKIEKAYRKAFLDWTALRRQCEQSMQQEMYVSDYYPNVSVTLSSGAQTVQLTTHSQREFVLPITVAGSGADQDTWDPALSMALYQVLPENAPLRDVFAGGDVLSTWAMFVASDSAEASAWVTCRTAVRPYAPY